MERRRVSIRFEEGEGCWRIYWSCTQDLADERHFKDIAEAGPVAFALMAEPPLAPILKFPSPRDKA